MNRFDKPRYKKPKSTRLVSFSAIALGFLTIPGCTITHKIEPSDKPFIVNMNINHEVKVKIEEQNQDILNLEQEYLKQKKAEAAPQQKKAT